MSKYSCKLKIWSPITISVVIFAAIAIGVIAYKIGEKPKNDILTLKNIVATFEKQGVYLKEDKSKSPDGFEIDGVKPAVFSLGEKKDTLLIYSFKTFSEREDKVNNNEKFSNQFSFSKYAFNAKNAFIVYIASQEPTTEEELKSLVETKTLISDTVFKYLNDGKVRVYKGDSPSWEGTYTLKYYEHWGQDETGKLNYEGYHNSYRVIKYKSSDISNVGTIDFKYKNIGGGGSLTGEELDKDGYLKCGSSGGSGAMPGENDEITFIIKWNGKEENITLRRSTSLLFRQESIRFLPMLLKT